MVDVCDGGFVSLRIYSFGWLVSSLNSCASGLVLFEISVKSEAKSEGEPVLLACT
jgi:hypothetical protein